MNEKVKKIVKWIAVIAAAIGAAAAVSWNKDVLTSIISKQAVSK